MTEPKWRLLLKKWWPVLTIALLVILLDQVTKLIVTSTMQPGETWLRQSPVQITYVRNSGSAFGLFQNQTFPLIIASFIAIGFILFYFRNTSKPPMLVIIAMGMQLGGALGNLIDRIRLGYVVDFIDFQFWPIFNAADSSISISLVMLGVYVLLFESKKKTPAPAIDSPPAEAPVSEIVTPSEAPTDIPPAVPQSDKRSE